MKRKQKFITILSLFASVIVNISFIHSQTVTSSFFPTAVTVAGASNTTGGGEIHSGTVVADFDGNGKVDIARVSSTNAEVFPNIHTTGNLAASSFGTPISLTTSTTPYNIYVGDVNLDGKLDLIVSASGNIDVFFNTSSSGNISFAAKQSLSAPNSISKLVLGDYTGDGKIDFSGVGQYGSNSLTFVPNTTVGNTFSLGTAITVSIGTSIRDFLLVDIDFDNDLDIFGIYTGIAYCSLNSSGVFSAVTTSAYSIAASNYSATHSLTSSDLNLDGKTDIIATQANTMYIFQNNHNLGGSSFSFSNLTFSSYTFTASGFALNVVAKDFNGDGLPEVLIPSSNSGTNDCFTNNSSGSSISFETTATSLGSSTIQTIRSADLNGDGLNDLIQHNYYSSNITIHQNTPPAPPAVSISIHPSTSTQTICSGTSGSALSITAANATSYQWQVSFNSGAYSNISGATTNSYTPAPTTAGTYTYQCIASNSGSTVTSNASGVLTVNPLPTLTTNPNTTLSQYCYSNPNTANGIVVATSASSPTYQWQESTTAGGTFTNVSTGTGGTSATFYPSHVDVWYGGTKYYRCVVTSNGCSTTSNTKPYGVYESLTQVTIPSTANENYCINSTPNNLTMVYSGDNNLQYQWYWTTDLATWPGTLISGATSTTYTPPTNAPTSRYYRCRVVGTCSNTAKNSGLITVTDTYTWTGATSTDPTVASNWSPAAVPCSGANEVIPTGLTNYPAYANLTIASGTTLTVQSGGRLTVTGTLTNDGTLTIQSGATLVQGASSTLAGTGTYNVQQAITGAGSTTPSGRFWYLGSPVSLASSSVYFGNAANVVKKRDEATNTWTTVASGTPENLTVGRGYYTQAMANSTINFTGGVVNNGAITISGLTRTAGQGFEGFNLVSNPYPSYLDWDAVTKTDVGNTMWYRTYNSSSNSMVFDTYVAGTNGIGTNLNGSGVSNLIPPMQSFWVRVNANANPSLNNTGSLGLTNSMRAHFTSINGSTGGLKSTNNDRKLFLRMNLLQENKKDQIIVYVNDNATNGFDQFDGEKMMQAGLPQFYTSAAGKKITINGLNSAKKQQALPITMELPTTGVHSFVIEDLEIDNGLVWLEDKQEEIMQALEPGTVYEFYANSGINAERFVLHFQLIDDATPVNVYNEVNSSANFSGKGASVHAEAAGVVVIKLPATTEGVTDIQIRDAAGKLVYTGSTNTLETSVQLAQANGIYYVTLNGTSGVEVRKVFVQQ